MELIGKPVRTEIITSYKTYFLGLNCQNSKYLHHDKITSKNFVDLFLFLLERASDGRGYVQKREIRNVLPKRTSTLAVYQSREWY